MARWVAVGERTGSVEGTFAQLVGYLDGEIERDSERLIALMEPAAIIVVGILIIYLLFTFVLPILSLLGSVL
jgi:type IV pilus assembly protein PilC